MAKIILIAALCLISASLSKALDKEEAIKIFMEKATACQSEVGATQADIEEIIAKKPASTKEGKCMRACVMKKFDVMDSNGKFVQSVALEHAKKHCGGDAAKMQIAMEITNACKDLAVSADACEAAEEYGRCFMEQAKAHNLDKFEF